MKMFEVGGCVRDELLGIKSKDIDFSVVLDKDDLQDHNGYRPPFVAMLDNLEEMGVRVFRDKDNVPIGAEHFTVSGAAPKDFPNHPGRALDFVLAREEGPYSDGRRPDWVKPGTLMDDLARRDFTMNAIAKAEDGSLVDPFNGEADLDAGLIRAVGDPSERMLEDALRVVRAIRFMVTKNMHLDPALEDVIQRNVKVHDALHFNISSERIRKELSTMFQFDSMRSVGVLSQYPAVMACVFADDVSLDATMKTKGRGK